MDVARMSEPGSTEGPSRQDLLRIYEQIKTSAVVEASADERKAHVIPSYLQSPGYRIIPVNPRGSPLLRDASTPAGQYVSYQKQTNDRSVDHD
jgi:hypothetical protein